MPSKIDSEVHHPGAQRTTTRIDRLKQAFSSFWTADGPIKSKLFIRGGSLRTKPEFSIPKSGPIYADGNCPGRALIDAVPELREIFRDAALAGANYPHPKEDGYLAAIARFTNAPEESVFAIGSGLKQLGAMVRHFQPTEVISLQGDFRGYDLNARHQGIAHFVVPARSGTDAAIYAALAARAGQVWRPLVMLTIGVTNPMATLVDAKRAVDEIKAANPNAVIVLDTAYVEYVGVTQAELTPLAIENQGVMIVAPGSKILYAAGAASGWIITGDSWIMGHLHQRAFPYEPSGLGSQLVPALIDSIEHVHKARDLVVQASEILQQGCIQLFGRKSVIGGSWPWILVDAGSQASKIADTLKAGGIHVQVQSGVNGQLPPSWIRISSTTPSQARIIIAALSRILHGESPAN